MNKVKVKIKKLPISNQGSPNFNEMAYQYTSSNPLSFKDLKDSTRMIGEDQYEIGKNYPTEKDPKKANIEAEKGELILTKDFELYKINGKPHTKGGTPLAVNEGDFIFSKKLEGSGKDFNKIFGNFDEKKKYSYADVASRFLKMNDHKVLSQDTNPIDKKTGERMYNDYKDKLGMLAFLQEVSKGLPNGIPAIAAPMIDRLTQAPMGMQPQMPQAPMGGMELPTMEEQETPVMEGQEMPNASEQMMKMGGPVLKKYVDGGTKDIDVNDNIEEVDILKMGLEKRGINTLNMSYEQIWDAYNKLPQNVKKSIYDEYEQLIAANLGKQEEKLDNKKVVKQSQPQQVAKKVSTPASGFQQQFNNGFNPQPVSTVQSPNNTNIGVFPSSFPTTPGAFGSTMQNWMRQRNQPVNNLGPSSFNLANVDQSIDQPVYQPTSQPAIDNSSNTNLTPEQWDSEYYQPLLKYLKAKYPGKDFSINNHADYQRLVTEYPETYAPLEDYFKTGKMRLTNKARQILKSKGVANADKIQYYAELPKEYQTPEFLKEQYNDGLAGYRGIKVVPNDGTVTGTTGQEQINPNTGMAEPSNSDFQYGNPDEGAAPYNQTLDPFAGGMPQVSNYRDLGYNTNENVAMMNALGAMTSIPYYAPTRMQNYGLQQGMGLAANVMPYNYQSLINEANRAGMRGFQANNAISPTTNIAAARNAMIAGQLAEQNSKTKGEEYNQNANLYNTNQMQLAQMASAIGQDKEQQGDLYNNRVVQGRENLYANKKLAGKEFIQEFANANKNRVMRNSMDYLMQSRDPNYSFQNADLMGAFNSYSNPFDLVTPSSGNSSEMAQFAKEIGALKGILGTADSNELLKSYQIFKQSRG